MLRATKMGVLVLGNDFSYIDIVRELDKSRNNLDDKRNPIQDVMDDELMPINEKGDKTLLIWPGALRGI